MAPTKRRVDTLFDQDSSSESSSDSPGEDDRARSSSTSQIGSNKRRRTTNETSIHDDSDMDEELPESTTAIDFEDEDALELMATQAIQEKYALQGANEPAENGILEEVLVENFMCHQHFRFPLGPLINFICGKNGSGKSAILTAISLCLGAKAASTNRGGSLKKFIKEGKESSMIQVKIKNQGSGAFMQEVFGDSIVVERHFNKTGASGFKIKSITGRLISAKRSMLEDICDHFSLQIENPMNVLTQDLARQFISQASPSFLYKSFIKGVQLEQLDQDYRLLEMSINNIEGQLEAREPDIAILRKRQQETRELLARFDQHDGLRNRMRELRRQIAWSWVIDHENKLQSHRDELVRIDASIAEHEAEVHRLQQLDREAERKFQEAETARQEANAAVDEATAKHTEEREREKEYRTDFRKTQKDRDAIQKQIRDEKTNIKNRRKDIETETERLQERDGGGAVQRMAVQKEIKTRLKETEKEIEEHAEQKPRLLKAVEDAEANLKMARERVSAQDNEVKKQQQSLQNLRDKRNVDNANFNPKMPELLRAIQNERRFTSRPIGPVGKHVNLLKPQWYSITENYLGGTLSSFIVTNTNDRNLLNSQMKRVGCHCPIYIGRNEPIDTSAHEPDKGFDTPLRVLEVDNQMVRNLLIVQHGADQTLLVADQDEAAKVMFGDLPRKPSNVRRCFSFSGTNRTKGHLLSYTKSGEAMQDAVTGAATRRMKTDDAAQLQAQTEVVEQAKEELHRLETARDTSQRATEEAKKALKKHLRDLAEMNATVTTISEELDEITNKIEQDEVDSGTLQVLQSQIEESQKRIDLNEGLFQDVMGPYDEKKQVLFASTAKADELTAEIAELEEYATRIQKRAQELDKEQKRKSMETNAATAKLNDGHDERKSKETEHNEQAEGVRVVEEKASQICARIPVPEGQTPESLTLQHERLKAQYEKFEGEMGISREEAGRAATTAKTALQEGLKDYDKFKRLHKSLKDSWVDRVNRWKAFRSFISCRAKATFVYLLSERSFRGRLTTDHKQRLLELTVEPDINQRSGEGRGARTLSGGEKSFSQICLLLAIWEAMGSPVRCLDEFDVYMDAVNRNMTVKLLVEAARQSKERQFILISPGTKSDLQGFRGAQDIHVQE